MAFRDLEARSTFYYRMDAQKDSEKRRSNLKPRQHQSEHDVYCDQMGILFPHGLNGPYSVRKNSYFYDRIRQFRGHTRQYWLVASITSLFFLLQVVIGAIQTALGAAHSSHILVTIFGALATVIGGILAYLKSRGQPNRTRQLRNSLRKVVEEIEFQEIQLRNPEIKTTAEEAVDYINQLYEDARFQAETNYPDFWSTAGTKATKPGSGASGPTATANLNSASSHPKTAQPASAQLVSTQLAGNRPPSYHPTSMQPTSAQNATPATPANHAPSSQQYTGPEPPDPVAHTTSEGGEPLKTPDLIAHIPSEGGKLLPVPNRAAHKSSRGGRFMNEMV